MERKNIFGLFFAATMICSNFAGVPVYAAEQTNYSDAGKVQVTDKDNSPIEEDTSVSVDDQFVMTISDVQFNGSNLELSLPNIDVQEKNVTIDGSPVTVTTTDNNGLVSDITLETTATGSHTVSIPFEVQKDTSLTVTTTEDEKSSDTTSSDDSSTSSSSDSEATTDDSSDATIDDDSTDSESTTSDASTESTEPKETTKDVQLTVSDAASAPSVEGKISWDKNVTDEEKSKVDTIKVDLLKDGQETGDSYDVKGTDTTFSFGKKAQGTYTLSVEGVYDEQGQEVADLKAEAKDLDVTVKSTKEAQKPTTNTETNKGSEDNNGTKTEENKDTTDSNKDSEESKNEVNNSGNNNGNTTVVDNSKTDVTLTHNDINVNIYAHQDNNTLVINQATDKDAEVLSTNDDQTVDVNGKIIWKDNSNAAKKRPSNVVVVLFANDKQYRALTVTGSGDEWDFTFKGLPKNDENGNAYKYAIKEKALENYRGDVNGYVLTNTYLGNNAAQTTSGTDTGTQTNTGLYFGVAGVAVVVIVVLVVLSKRKKA